MNKTPYLRLFGPFASSGAPLARLVIILGLLLTLLPVQPVNAAEGDLDAAFPGEGSVGADWNINALAVQADGKILIAGDFSHVGGLYYQRLARLNSDGSLDTTYRAGLFDGPDSAVNAIEILPSGKALVAGAFTTVDGQPRTNIARLNADGTLDATFNVAISGNTTPSINAIALVQDGADKDILIGGAFTKVNDTNCANIARLNPDGSLDAVFMQTLPGTDGKVQAIILQPDGKILIGGNFINVGIDPRPRLARLNANGSLDQDFSWLQDGANGVVNAIAVQPDGKVLVGGYFTAINGMAQRPYLARLTASGVPDTAYLSGADQGPNGAVFTILMQSDGKAVIGGSFTLVNGAARRRLARLNLDGSLDASYMVGATGANGAVAAFKLLSSGKLLVAGSFSQMYTAPRGRIARLNTDGALDNTFMITGADNEVTALALQPDGKILVGGKFGVVNGLPRSTLARLTADGALDVNFLYGKSGPNAAVDVIVVQPDGKILIGGQFSSVNDQPCGHIARLNPDGSLDSSFTCQTTGGVNGDVSALLLLPDGKFLAGGHFTLAGDYTYRSIARFLPTGVTDTTFADAGVGGTYPIVYSLARQADGKIVMVGDFKTVDGVNRQYVARLTANGSLDTTYLNGVTGPSSVVRWVDLDAQGNAIIGGWFTQVNGADYKRVARLNKTDGSPDAAFLSGANGPENGVRALKVLPGGKILIGGEFTNFDGTYRRHIARLNADGTLDASFNGDVAGSSNVWVNAVVIQNDLRVLIGGNFTSVSGLERGRIARLDNGYRIYLPNLVR